MKNKQLISVLNYDAIGKGILNETIGFNQDIYEFIKTTREHPILHEVGWG